MKRLASPHALILPLTFSLLTLGCDDFPTDGADTFAEAAGL